MYSKTGRFSKQQENGKLLQNFAKLFFETVFRLFHQILWEATATL